MNKNITITITGDNGVGKTFLAAYLSDLFATHGVVHQVNGAASPRPVSTGLPLPPEVLSTRACVNIVEESCVRDGDLVKKVIPTA